MSLVGVKVLIYEAWHNPFPSRIYANGVWSNHAVNVPDSGNQIAHYCDIRFVDLVCQNVDQLASVDNKLSRTVALRYVE
jgi:hypothetical protein